MVKLSLFSEKIIKEEPFNWPISKFSISASDGSSYTATIAGKSWCGRVYPPCLNDSREIEAFDAVGAPCLLRTQMVVAFIETQLEPEKYIKRITRRRFLYFFYDDITSFVKVE